MVNPIGKAVLLNITSSVIWDQEVAVKLARMSVQLKVPLRRYSHKISLQLHPSGRQGRVRQGLESNIKKDEIGVGDEGHRQGQSHN